MKEWLWFAQSRAPISLDILALVLLILLPLQIISLLLLKGKRSYRGHMIMQVIMTAILGPALIAFEIQIRISGWRHLAELSPYYDNWVLPALLFHLIWAIPAVLLWIVAIYGAFKNFGLSPRPGRYSMIHKRMGRLAVLTMVGTGLSGWLFYWLAFIATETAKY